MGLLLPELRSLVLHNLQHLIDSPHQHTLITTPTRAHTHTPHATTETCNGVTGKPFQTPIADNGTYMPGMWASYYPNYATSCSASGVSSTSQDPLFTQLRFNRLEPGVSYTLGTDIGDYGNGAVTNWDTTFSPVACLIDKPWYKEFLVEYEFRIVAPCDGEYVFANTPGGMLRERERESARARVCAHIWLCLCVSVHVCLCLWCRSKVRHHLLPRGVPY